jgi:hypothetical protein
VSKPVERSTSPNAKAINSAAQQRAREDLIIGRSLSRGDGLIGRLRRMVEVALATRQKRDNDQ